MKIKNIIRIALIALLVLAIPLAAMQFTDEVDWDVYDFVVMGTLLFSAGLAYELIVKKARSTNKQIILAIVLLVILLLIWAELAVGVFGSPFAGS